MRDTVLCFIRELLLCRLLYKGTPAAGEKGGLQAQFCNWSVTASV